jgi:predicted HicB family RNase H-like nuclease
MKNTELKIKLKRIESHFDDIEEIFNELPNGMRDIIYNYHNADTSLDHCIRWGTTAIQELLEDVPHLVEKYNENYGRNKVI